MTNLEAVAVELNRARREVDRRRAELAEARKALNARLEILDRAVRAERRAKRAA